MYISARVLLCCCAALQTQSEVETLPSLVSTHDTLNVCVSACMCVYTFVLVHQAAPQVDTGALATTRELLNHCLACNRPAANPSLVCV